MALPNEISPTKLNRLIGTHQCPTIIDVCIDEDFEEDPRLVPTAIRVPHTNISKIAATFKTSKVVVVCQKGLKLSQGAAAMLRTNGIDCEYLEGGIHAWRDAGLPLIPYAKIPARNSDGHTLWVTRLRPKVDRIACLWLIRRFIDPTAKFLFVSSSQVQNVAEKFDATPFDIEGTFWGHRNQDCTFDIMIKEFCLETEPLLSFANIIRGADTDNHDLAPQIPGFLAASLGLSRMYKQDLEQLDASMVLYDAYYRWLRDAQDEVHDSHSKISSTL